MSTRVKCLLVDDRDDNLLSLSALLRREDVELLTARSGAEALDLLLSHEVALALVDVQMPEMDGFELAEIMRGSDRTRHIPIIFITAGEHDRHRVFQGYERGAVDFLHKPVEPHILRNKAEVFFELYRHKHQLAEELNHRTQTLRLNEMFSAVLGHDLRNPLGAIVTCGHVLEYQSKDPAVKQTADRILSSARRMSRMIDDLLDLTRARLAGGIVLKRDPMDLTALVQRVIQEHAAVRPDRRIECAAGGEIFGEWDADRLAQVVSNLVGNALQHGDPSGVVEVRLEPLNDRAVTLVVRNAGQISDEVLANLFDPFRGHQHNMARTEGLGLGLYIVQQIILAHGGTIDVSSSEGVTTFEIHLPRRAVEVVKL